MRPWVAISRTTTRGALEDVPMTFFDVFHASSTQNSNRWMVASRDRSVLGSFKAFFKAVNTDSNSFVTGIFSKEYLYYIPQIRSATFSKNRNPKRIAPTIVATTAASTTAPSASCFLIKIKSHHKEPCPSRLGSHTSSGFENFGIEF